MECGGKVSHQEVVIVGGTGNLTVGSESTTNHREPTKARLRNLSFVQTETVVLLSEFGFLRSSLRLVILVEDLSTFAKACGREDPCQPLGSALP